MLAVVDDTWAARSFTNVIVREGQSQDKLDFALIKGTLLRGRVTGEPGGRIPEGTTVMLLEHGGLLPKEFRGVIADKAELVRDVSVIGADGRFQFRVGPGTYTLQGGTRQSQRVESPKVSVVDESEVVHDLTLKLSPPETAFKGVVIVSTPTGERGVAKARVVVSPLGSGTTADDQGRFEIRRKPGPIVFFAYSEEQGLGGFTVVSADAASSRLVISKGASVTGRIVDTDGKPQAMHRVGIRLSPRQDYVTRFGIAFRCDQEGRFTFKCAPIESEGELSAPHLKDSSGRATFARTVMPFEVDGPETVEVPDLVVPAEKGALTSWAKYSVDYPSQFSFWIRSCDDMSDGPGDIVHPGGFENERMRVDGLYQLLQALSDIGGIDGPRKEPGVLGGLLKMKHHPQSRARKSRHRH